MASYTGLTSPTARFSLAIDDSFPTPNRQHKIEASIANKYITDFSPLNANLQSGHLNDSYIEYFLPPTSEEFYNFNEIALELKVRFLKEDGTPVDNTDNISFIDGISDRIINRHSVFMNGVQVEGQSYYGLVQSIKKYTSLNNDTLYSRGWLLGYKSLYSSTQRVYDAAYFGNDGGCEQERDFIAAAKNTCHFMAPLNLDIASANTYILNGVGVRIRLELAPPSVVINSSDNSRYRYRIEMSKLWVEKMTPIPSALISLNKSLTQPAKSIEYLFERPVTKCIIFPSQHRNINVDNIFNDVIPEKIYCFMIDQTALNGSYTYNAACFPHCSIRSVRLELNGNTIANISCNFPHEFSQLFYQTLTALNTDNHLFTYSNYKNGRCIMAWDLANSNTHDTVNVERRGHLRLSIELAQALATNHALFIIGITNGVMEISSSRRVSTNYLL